MVICLEQGADLHMAQLMPLPLTVCCFSKIQIGCTFLVPAHPGSPGKRAVKRMCVCDGCLKFVYIGKIPGLRHFWTVTSTENELGLAFSPRNLPKKFCPDPSTFYLVIVVTNKQTDRQTNASKNIIPRFRGDNYISCGT